MYQVALLNFEGPLDLLLQLIEKSDVEVTEIALSDITAQYLTYLSKLPELEPSELNQFLDLASRLVYLKSAALLPLSRPEDLQEEIADLTEQLAQYQKYQFAAKYLEQLISQKQQAWTRPAMPYLPPEKLPLPNISLQKLQAAFNNAIAQLPSPFEKAPQPKTISMADMASRITKWLSDQGNNVSLGSFLGTLSSRSELIIAFMALLELMRQQIINVTQIQAFGDIVILRLV